MTANVVVVVVVVAAIAIVMPSITLHSLSVRACLVVDFKARAYVSYVFYFVNNT